MTVVADVLARFRTEGLTDVSSQATATADSLGRMGDPAQALHGHLSNAGDAASGLSGNLGAAGGVLDSITEKAHSAGGAIKEIAASFAGAASFGALLDMATRTTAELQTLGVQFNSTFGANGAEMLQNAVTYANNFGQSIASAGAAFSTFGQATRGGVENISKDMKDFADIAAGTGSTVDQVSSSISNYYQLVQRLGGSGGSASRFATTLLEQHIIDPATYNELRIQANKGATPNQLLNDILGDAEKEYGGAGKAEANTFSGRLQTFKNIFSESASGALSPITGGIGNILGDLSKGMQTSSFKTAETDVASFISTIGRGAEILLPFVKSMADIGLALGEVVSKSSILRPVIEALVAAFIAFEAIKIGSSLAMWVSSLAQGTTSGMAMRQSTISLTDAILALNEALAQNAQLMSIDAGVSSAAVEANVAKTASVSTLAAGEVGLAPATALGGEEGATVGGSALLNGDLLGGGVAGGLLARGTGSLLTASPLAVGAGIGIGGMLLSDVVGGAVGGSSGSTIKTVGSDVSIGAGVGAIAGNAIPIPGVGMAVGAAVGAALGGVVGLITNHLQNASNAVASFADAVNAAAKVQQDSGGFSTGTTATDVTGNVKAARSEVSASSSADYQYARSHGYASDPSNFEIANLPESLRGSRTAANRRLSSYEDQQYNANANLGVIQAETGLSRGQASSFAQSNDINITQNLNGNLQNLTAAIQAFSAKGGLQQFNAEQYSNILSTTGTVASGAAGESSFNLDAELSKLTGLSGPAAYSQFSKQAFASGINLSEYGINPQSAATNQMTSGQAEELNSQIEATQQLRDAYNALGQAEFAATQAAFGLAQAEFSLGQAQFQQGEAAFQAGRATLSMSVAMTTQRDSLSAVNTAITSGYLPANYNVAATMEQITSLSAGQRDAIMSEVSAYNAVEAAMYQVNAAGQSLYSTYTQLSGNVQVAQANMQGYQNTLGQTLQGVKAFQQAQESESMASAATSMAMAQLQLAGYSTSSPEYINAQRQAAIEQAQSTITTSQNTLGLGNEQFQISQAQMPPPQSFQAMLAAAQGVGALQGPLYSAQQALAAITPAYDSANTALQIQSQRNQALTSALNQQASADQGVITNFDNMRTANNALLTSTNGIAVAENGIATAQNSVKTSSQGIADAANNLTTAANNFEGNFSTQVVKAFTAMTTNINTIGTDTAKLGTKLVQTFALLNAEAEANAKAAAAQKPQYQQYWSSVAAGESALVGSAGSLSQSQLNAAVAVAFGNAPHFAEGGLVPGSGAMVAVVHGGEGVLTPTQMGSLKTALSNIGVTITPSIGSSSSAMSSGGGGGVTVADGAVQVRIDVNGSMLGSEGELQQTVATTVNEAFIELINQMNGK
jgi:hypothetical protein